MTMMRFLQSSLVGTEMPFLVQIGILEHYMLLEQCIRVNHELIRQMMKNHLEEQRPKPQAEEEWSLVELVESVRAENESMLLELGELKILVQDYYRRVII